SGSDEDEGDDVSNDVAPAEAAIVETVAEQAGEDQAAAAAVEGAAVVTEDVKPARGRGRRKAAASPVEAPVAEAEAAPAAEIEPEVAEASADLQTPAQEETKPVRANRESNITSSEPTVKSTRSENGESDDGKPKKAGWWQRRGFF
ncbi:hypothetical protein B5K05_10520, partial [Rhizobium phaseoli]